MTRLRQRPARPDFRERTSGLLLHLTSLPGSHGSGDLSRPAHDFIDFLATAGQSWWQVLPVGPPAGPPENSPYNAYSALAGSPYLVSLDTLRREGWLSRGEVDPGPRFPTDRVDFPRVRAYREERLRRAWERFRARKGHCFAAFREFVVRHSEWLDDFALFCTLKPLLHQAPWTEWPAEFRWRRPGAMEETRRRYHAELDYHRWVQFQFQRQWEALRHHAKQRRVGLIGDVPIFVAHDSADVWAHPELFALNARGEPSAVSGYPPDPGCPRGQRWGHPQYRWTAHRRSGFQWWIARLARAFELFDAVRLDHFLGFTRLWSIPAKARSPRQGRWVPSPGRALFAAVTQALGRWPMIAEDLGHVTPADVALRDDLGLPAMRVLQWGWGPGDPAHRPHAFTPDTIAYPGTHDTDTVVGWFRSLSVRSRREVLAYTGTPGEEVQWDLLRLACQSVARTVITPVQDLLGLDSRARMNRPGTPSGNWQWRVREGRLTSALAARLRRITRSSDRLPRRTDAG